MMKQQSVQLDFDGEKTLEDCWWFLRHLYDIDLPLLSLRFEHESA